MSLSKCPGCNNSLGTIPRRQCVGCRDCSRTKRRVYQYCFTCQREWQSNCPVDAACSLSDCSFRSAMLSPKRIDIPGCSVNGCPYFRACPNCKAILNHTGFGCPSIICPTCNTNFCYRCLRQDCFGIVMFADCMRRNRCTMVENIDVLRREPNCALPAAMPSSERINNPDSSVHGCPYFRACPSCKALLNHNESDCSRIQCSTCKTTFCYRCRRQECFGSFAHDINRCTIVEEPVN